MSSGRKGAFGYRKQLCALLPMASHLYVFDGEFVTSAWMPYHILCSGKEQKNQKARTGLGLTPSRCTSVTQHSRWHPHTALL